MKLPCLSSTQMMKLTWGNRRWTTLLVFDRSLFFQSLLAVLVIKDIIYLKHLVLLPTTEFQIERCKPRQQIIKQVLSSLCHRRTSTEQPMETVKPCSKCHRRYLSQDLSHSRTWRDSLLYKKRKRISLITMSTKLIQMTAWAPSTEEKEYRILETMSLMELSTDENQSLLM